MRDIAGEKTQKATPKRRKEERGKGNIFQSRDITGAFGLLGLFLFFQLTALYCYNYFYIFMRQYLGGLSNIEELTPLTAKNYIADFTIKSMLLSLPFLLVTAGLAIAFDMAQTKLNFSFSRLKPDFSKISLLKGIKKLVTLRSLTELLKSSIKITIITIVAYTEIKANMRGFISLFDKGIFESLSFIGHVIYLIVIKVGMYLLAFGVLDYLYQWWDYERQIRMSFQDIKDEYKQTEGNPQIKGQQRDRQRRMSMQRIAQKVPLADAIIRNPTHFAVAIKYDPKVDKAPKVIAKGQDYLALKIIEIAEANHISITTNPPLARGIFESVELDQEIPEKYYQAVAEVLIFVYTKLRK